MSPAVHCLIVFAIVVAIGVSVVVAIVAVAVVVAIILVAVCAAIVVAIVAVVVALITAVAIVVVFEFLIPTTPLMLVVTTVSIRATSTIVDVNILHCLHHSLNLLEQLFLVSI